MKATWSAARSAVLSLPGVGLALMPKLVCPACWPAYAALLSALGLGFIPTAPYLLPLTVAFLVIALAALFFRARTHFILGFVASAVILVGKFVLASSVMTYGGAALLALASFAVLGRRTATTCPACAPARSARSATNTIPTTERR